MVEFVKKSLGKKSGLKTRSKKGIISCSPQGYAVGWRMKPRKPKKAIRDK